MNKSKLNWLIPLVLLMVCSSCSKQPVASFEFDQNNVKAPATITFTNTSVNAHAFLWSFDDGNTSTETDPVHEYLKGGDFDVTLKAYGEDDTHTTTRTITILPNMTGHWNISFQIGQMTMTGMMNIVENENKSLTGEFKTIDDPAYTPFGSESLIDGFSVKIKVMLFGFYEMTFEGTVNSTYDSMSGETKINGLSSGTWYATKI